MLVDTILVASPLVLSSLPPQAASKAPKPRQHRALVLFTLCLLPDDDGRAREDRRRGARPAAVLPPTRILVNEPARPRNTSATLSSDMCARVRTPISGAGNQRHERSSLDG